MINVQFKLRLSKAHLLGANENVTNVQKHFFEFYTTFPRQKALFWIDLKITTVFFPAADTSFVTWNKYVRDLCQI